MNAARPNRSMLQPRMTYHAIKTDTDYIFDGCSRGRGCSLRRFFSIPRNIRAGIKLAGQTVGTGMQEFLGDKDKMMAATATLTAMALGIYTARTGTGDTVLPVPPIFSSRIHACSYFLVRCPTVVPVLVACFAQRRYRRGCYRY